MKRYLTAKEAAEMLGVSTATLYAYVSRGLIRSEEIGTKSRARHYLTEDVRKLKDRKDYRRNPARVAQDALHWGAPLLDSGLTLILDEGLYYRGQDALALARTSTIEQVAALLWTGSVTQAESLFAPQPLSAQVLKRMDADLTPVRRMMLALTLADDLAAYDLHPEAVARTGARILRLMAAAVTGQDAAGEGIAIQLQRAWRKDDAHLARLIDAALILCADHELNVSSFTARVVASAEATPYAVVIGGLAAVQGFRHGGNTERVEAYFREVGRPERIASVTAERLRRGEYLPGFGHTLYPHGDPRAILLLRLIAEAYPETPQVQLVFAMIEQVSRLIEQRPNVDFALAALALAAGLPEGSPLTLFALGRSVGWIGHAIEQYASGGLIRPRARYVGETPTRD